MQNPALLMYWDDRRKAVAEVAIPAAFKFAYFMGCSMGLDLICEHQAEYAEPYLHRLDMVLRELPHRPWVLYADVDVLFRQDRQLRLESPMMVSQDANGLCCGFFMAKNTPEVLNLFSLWRQLGCINNERYGPHQFDQGTLKLLRDNFDWIKNLVGLIPRTLVSSKDDAQYGTVAHHFWSGTIGDKAAAEQMKALRDAT